MLTSEKERFCWWTNDAVSGLQAEGRRFESARLHRRIAGLTSCVRRAAPPYDPW